MIQQPLFRHLGATKLSALCCVGFAWLLNARAAEPQPIAVTVGQEFKISLQSNPTTGYQWEFAKRPDQRFLKGLGTKFEPSRSELAGAGGTQVWTFKALAEGKITLELRYDRSWEKKTPAAQRTNFMVVITNPKAKAKASADSGQ
jgi:inhibitor of cysteine peptidase